MLFNPTLYKIWAYFVLTTLFPIVLPVRIYEYIIAKKKQWRVG